MDTEHGTQPESKEAPWRVDPVGISSGAGEVAFDEVRRLTWWQQIASRQAYQMAALLVAIGVLLGLIVVRM